MIAYDARSPESEPNTSARLVHPGNLELYILGYIRCRGKIPLLRQWIDDTLVNEERTL